jgi:hypothetical protein
VSRSVRVWKNTIRWQVDPVLPERRFVTLLVRLDIDNESIQDFYLVPSIKHRHRFTLRLKDAWLDQGERLDCLANFCDAVKRAYA